MNYYHSNVHDCRWREEHATPSVYTPKRSNIHGSSGVSHFFQNFLYEHTRRRNSRVHTLDTHFRISSNVLQYFSSTLCNNIVSYILLNDTSTHSLRCTNMSSDRSIPSLRPSPHGCGSSAVRPAHGRRRVRALSSPP